MTKTLESSVAPNNEEMIQELKNNGYKLDCIIKQRDEKKERDIALHEFIVNSHKFIVKKENQASRSSWMQVLIGVIALGLATASLSDKGSAIRGFVSVVVNAFIRNL